MTKVYVTLATMMSISDEGWDVSPWGHAVAAGEESSAAIDQITNEVANVNTIVDKVTKEVSQFRI